MEDSGNGFPRPEDEGSFERGPEGIPPMPTDGASPDTEQSATPQDATPSSEDRIQSDDTDEDPEVYAGPLGMGLQGLIETEVNPNADIDPNALRAELLRRIIERGRKKDKEEKERKESFAPPEQRAPHESEIIPTTPKGPEVDTSFLDENLLAARIAQDDRHPGDEKTPPIAASIIPDPRASPPIEDIDNGHEDAPQSDEDPEDPTG